ncbi:hypothetical protein RFI_19767, partial [Reticulomyxa filosa]
MESGFDCNKYNFSHSKRPQLQYRVKVILYHFWIHLFTKNSSGRSSNKSVLSQSDKSNKSVSNQIQADKKGNDIKNAYEPSNQSLTYNSNQVKFIFLEYRGMEGGGEKREERRRQNNHFLNMESQESAKQQNEHEDDRKEEAISEFEKYYILSICTYKYDTDDKTIVRVTEKKQEQVQSNNQNKIQQDEDENKVCIFFVNVIEIETEIKQLKTKNMTWKEIMSALSTDVTESNDPNQSQSTIE